MLNLKTNQLWVGIRSSFQKLSLIGESKELNWWVLQISLISILARLTLIQEDQFILKWISQFSISITLKLSRLTILKEKVWIKLRKTNLKLLYLKLERNKISSKRWIKLRKYSEGQFYWKHLEISLTQMTNGISATLKWYQMMIQNLSLTIMDL